MITVIGHYDPGWFGREYENNTDYMMYFHTCAAYGVELRMVGPDDLVGSERKIVIFDEDGDISLQDFMHPEDALYIFGRTGQDLKLWYPDAVSVRIETPNASPLFGHVACGIVLADWWRKNGGDG